MIEAILRLQGTVPACSEELMMFVIVGQRVGRQLFTSAVGMGSREQVVELAFMTNSVTMEASTLVKEDKRHVGRLEATGSVS